MVTIDLKNNTAENIKVAVFKKPYRKPSLKLIAWKTLALPKLGGSTSVTIPNVYDVYINYSRDPKERENPFGGVRTASISIDSQTARFVAVEESTNDNNGAVVTLKRVFTNLVDNEIHIDNQASFGVWGHIQLNSADVYPPDVITPGRTLMEDVRSLLYIGVVDEFIKDGDIMRVEEIRTLPCKVETGDAITIDGSKWDGYQFSK